LPPIRGWVEGNRVKADWFSHAPRRHAAFLPDTGHPGVEEQVRILPCVPWVSSPNVGVLWVEGGRQWDTGIRGSGGFVVWYEVGSGGGRGEESALSAPRVQHESIPMRVQQQHREDSSYKLRALTWKKTS